MAFGSKARDPITPYIVYAFEWRSKIFYIGICQRDSTRHTHRWSFVKNLVQHENRGTLKPDKQAELYRKSNSVIATLIRSGLEPHEPKILLHCTGRAEAELAETKFIREHLDNGCILANVQGLGSQFSAAQVLEYLGLENAV